MEPSSQNKEPSQGEGEMTIKKAKPIYPKTGLECQHLRKSEGLTQLALVEAIDSEIKKVSRIECGYQLPDLKYMEKLDAMGANTKVLRQLVNRYKEEKMERRKKVIDQSNDYYELSIDKDQLQKDSIEIKINGIKITIEYSQ